MIFSDIPAGAALFIDANTLVYHFTPNPALGPACRQFLDRIARGELTGFGWGRKIADRRRASTSPQQLATRVLQRVEMDRSPLKVVVGADAGRSGQPWLSGLVRSTRLVDYLRRPSHGRIPVVQDARVDVLGGYTCGNPRPIRDETVWVSEFTSFLAKP